MDPITWLYLITAVLGYIQQDQAAGKQEDALQDQADRREMDRRRQQDEAWQAAQQQTNELARQQQADLALFDTLVGEFGGGKTSERARAVSQVQAGEAMATVAANARSGFSQLGFSGLADQARSRSQLAAINRPSMLGTALQMGTAYYEGQRRNPSKTPSTAGQVG